MSFPRPSMANRLLALSRMSAHICRAESEADLLATTGEHIHDLLGVAWVGIGLRSTDGRRYRLIALGGTDEADLAGTDLPSDDLAFRQAAESGQSIEETNLAQSPFRDLAGLATAGMSGALVVPLRVIDHQIGAMIIARRTGGGFTPDDHLLALQSAAFIAAATKNLRAQAEALRAEMGRHRAQMILGRRADELDALNRIFRDFNGADLGQAVELACEEFALMRGIELCRVSAVDDRGQLRVIASSAEHGARFQDTDSLLEASSPDARAVATLAPTLWRRPDDHDRAAIEGLQALGVTSVFSLPILWQGSPVAALTAGSTGGHRLVTDEHVVIGELVCREMASLAAANGFTGLVARSGERAIPVTAGR